jgi:hypothetical protein
MEGQQNRILSSAANVFHLPWKFSRSYIIALSWNSNMNQFATNKGCSVSKVP